MTRKHTQGPWRAGYYDDSSGYDCMTGGLSIGPNAAGPIHLDGANYGQGRCKAISRESIERMLADANLIAAAPDLLDAAEMAFCLLDNFVEDPRVDVEIKATMAELQKAINKAKGE